MALEEVLPLGELGVGVGDHDVDAAWEEKEKEGVTEEREERDRTSVGGDLEATTGLLAADVRVVDSKARHGEHVWRDEREEGEEEEVEKELDQ